MKCRWKHLFLYFLWVVENLESACSFNRKCKCETTVWAKQCFIISMREDEGQHTHTHIQPQIGFMFNVSLTAATEWLTTIRWVNVTVSYLCSNSPAVKKLAKGWISRQLQPVREINVNSTASLLNGFLQRLFFWLFFYPQSCDCNVKPLTGKHRRTTPLRRQRMLRFARNSTSCWRAQRGRTCLR